MATRKRIKKLRAPTGGGASPFSSQRELIVVAKPSAGLRALRGTVSSVSRANVTSLNSLLSSQGATIAPLFGNEDRVARALSTAYRRPAVYRTPEASPVLDLTTFYRVEANDDRLDDLAAKMLDHGLVAGAYVKPAPEPPVYRDQAMAAPESKEAPPASPDFNSRQLYLDASPGGIDARFAWTRPGGKGQGVQIIDIEGAWRFSHEDLLQNQGGVIGGTPSTDIGWRNHGTAVTGEFSGDDNGIGVTGICPLANVRAISIFGTGQSPSKAITDAANALNPGDIILIELHAPGPRNNWQSRADQLGYIAEEFWPDNFAAIVYATSVRGVIVVEAGGNGAENFDDALYGTRPAGFPATWSNPFNLANPQSGAIIVGAGAPPPGTHGRSYGADRSRLDFSNYGARVDVQGWGREVTTTGYGDLQGGTNEDVWYTDQFSGTSSASPIIVGTLGAIQGGLRAGGKPLLTPATATSLLRTTGSPQQDEPGRPATQRIGNRPDLKQAFTSLGIGGKGAVKEVKDLKLERKEVKEIREKDPKERIKEKVELKEVREKNPKEIIKEKDKDLVERKVSDKIQEVIRPPDSGAGSPLEDRVAGLEQAIGELSHFITTSLRPDLQSSALSQEADLRAVSQDLEKQANDAKGLKDDKDLEKLREG
jgi:hypothetical protein